MAHRPGFQAGKARRHCCPGGLGKKIQQFKFAVAGHPIPAQHGQATLALNLKGLAVETIYGFNLASGLPINFIVYGPGYGGMGINKVVVFAVGAVDGGVSFFFRGVAGFENLLPPGGFAGQCSSGPYFSTAPSSSFNFWGSRPPSSKSRRSRLLEIRMSIEGRWCNERACCDRSSRC